MICGRCSRGSVALGRHPRYTDLLGSRTTIYSVSRDDGELTTVDARTLAVVGCQPAHVPQPSFLVVARAASGATREPDHGLQP